MQVQEIKSAPLKAEPSPFHPTSPEARAALQAVVSDTFDWFKRLVAERRKLDEAQIGDRFDRTDLQRSAERALAGSSTSSAASATPSPGSSARSGVRRDLPVRDWKPRDASRFDLWTAAAVGADLLGFGEVAVRLRHGGAAAQLATLDGLLALWQPALEKMTSRDSRF